MPLVPHASTPLGRGIPSLAADAQVPCSARPYLPIRTNLPTLPLVAVVAWARQTSRQCLFYLPTGGLPVKFRILTLTTSPLFT